MTHPTTASRRRLVPVALLATLGATTGLASPAQAQTPAQNPTSTAPQPSTVGAPVRGQSSYTVERGDTLSHIALATGTSTAQLRAANGLPDSRIRAGQTLVIPAPGSPAPSAPAPASAGGGSHQVQRGQTFDSIAKARGLRTADLVAANPGINPRALRAGQTITIPGGGSAPAPASSSSAPTVPNSFGGRTYPEQTVRSANVNKQALHERDVPGRDQMREIVAQAARANGVDPALAVAIAHQESGFNMRAVSPANAVGAMQVIPSSGEWASRMAGRPLDLMDPHDNATAGVLILKAHQNTGASEDFVIASYYQGRGSVTRNGMYPDTRQYVANVQSLKARY